MGGCRLHCDQEHGKNSIVVDSFFSFLLQSINFIFIPQFAADVVVCNRDPANDMIEALDTYNPVAGRANNVDARQDVFLFNSSFDGTRIFCT